MCVDNFMFDVKSKQWFYNCVVCIKTHRLSGKLYDNLQIAEALPNVWSILKLILV